MKLPHNIVFVIVPFGDPDQGLFRHRGKSVALEIKGVLYNLRRTRF